MILSHLHRTMNELTVWARAALFLNDLQTRESVATLTIAEAIGESLERTSLLLDQWVILGWVKTGSGKEEHRYWRPTHLLPPVCRLDDMTLTAVLGMLMSAALTVNIKGIG